MPPYVANHLIPYNIIEETKGRYTSKLGNWIAYIRDAGPRLDLSLSASRPREIPVRPLFTFRPERNGCGHPRLYSQDKRVIRKISYGCMCTME